MITGTLQAYGAVSLTRSNGGTPTSLVSWDGTFTAGAGAVTLTGVNGVAATNPGTTLSLTGGNGNTTGAGGLVALQGGVGGATGAGGAVTLTAGAGGATSGAGGALTLLAGAAVGGGLGGAVGITAGAGIGANAGGGVTLSGGAAGATGAGGGITLTAAAGGATSGSGGSVLITVGGQTSGTQGVVTLVAPAAGTAPALQFRESAASGTNFFSLQAAATMAVDNPYTWPDAYPASSGFQLASTTAGVLSWAASAGVSRFPFTLTEAGSDNFTVTHSFGLTGNFTVSTTLQDNNTLEVIPDSITFTSGNAITINLASYRAANGGTLPAGFVGVVLG